MENKIEFISSEIKYLENVKLLLCDYNLPYEDIDIHFKNYILAKEEDKIVGAIGLEIYGDIALLRSFVVEESFRNKGIGKKLLISLLNRSIDERIETIYLLTTTAEKYFFKNGFKIENRKNLPDEIKQTKEFSCICPCSAVAMSNKK